MKLVTKSLNEIHMYKNNPRNNASAVDKVAKSIEAFGFKVPIVVDSNNEIVAGHTRYLAAEKLGFTELPCVVADDLTERQIKAFRIADNKVAEEASWDYLKLAEELVDFDMDFDFDTLGFDEHELEGILNLGRSFAPIGPDIDEDADNIYRPVTDPSFGTRDVEDRDVEKSETDIAGRFNRADTQKQEIVCPHCGETFEIE